MIYIDNIWIQMLVFLVEMIYMENILHIYVDIIENCNNSLAICDGFKLLRRSTMTSNMTLVTSSDASEYVQQESCSELPFQLTSPDQLAIPESLQSQDYPEVNSPSFSLNTYQQMSPDSTIPEVTGFFLLLS